MNNIPDNAPATKKDIHELADLISANFTRINERFQLVDQQFQNLKKDMMEEFKQVRRDILRQDERFPTLYAFDNLSARVGVLEEKASFSDERADKK